MPRTNLLRTLLLPVLLGAPAMLLAQVPIIDYDFQAVPPSSSLNKVVVQPDGKILIGGFFMNYAGSGKNHLVRLNPDGTVDPTWNTSGAGPSNQVMDIALMTDGRIVIAGNFVTYNGTTSYFITRLQPNGHRDFTFNIPANAINGAVHAIDLQDHDKVIAVGEFFECFGHSMPRIARFHNDGAVDLDFDMGSGFNGTARTVLVLPDSRIVVGGDFTNYNGNGCGRLALLTANGPFDATMQSSPGFGGGQNTVRTILRRNDGQILVGGSFATHHGQPCRAIAVLGLDGVRDASFTSPFYPYAMVSALAEQADGHLFAGGEFSGGMYEPNVPGPSRLLRLLSNGTRNDDAYDVGEGFGPGQQITHFVRDITIQDDGKILVGGLFGSFHSPSETQYRNLIRLHPQAATGITEASASYTLQVAVDPGSGDLLLWHPFPQTGQGTLRIHGASGQLVQERTLHSAQDGPLRMAHDLSPGMYLLVVDGAGQRATGRVVVF